MPDTSILVIEDDEHIGQILTFILQRQGYKTTHAADEQGNILRAAEVLCMTQPAASIQM